MSFIKDNCRQVLKILRSPSYDLTGEECREIWDEIWKEAMRRKRELRKLKSEEERQSWILAVVKRKLEEKKIERQKSQIMRQKEERIMVECG